MGLRSSKKPTCRWVPTLPHVASREKAKEKAVMGARQGRWIVKEPLYSSVNSRQSTWGMILGRSFYLLLGAAEVVQGRTC